MSTIPKNKQSDHETLWLECAQLHWELGAFEYLYAKDQSLLDILSETAPGFFKLLQPVLWDAMVLSICRMLDPDETGKFKNLSLRRLLKEEQSRAVDSMSPERLKCAELAVEEAESKQKFARSWRDKRLSHNDLDQILLKPPPDSLVAGKVPSAISRGTLVEMRSAVDAVAKALDALSNPKCASDFGKFHGEFAARGLLTYLEEGFLRLADQREALLAGQNVAANLSRGRVHEYERKRRFE
jgi:hypothetical protein